MGREIRRVPGDWEHPKYTRENSRRSDEIGKFMPLHDQDYETAAEEWMKGLDLWRQGKHEDQPSKYSRYYWEYDSPPDEETHRARKWTEAEATHYQVYETVSEGTPITPPMPTKEALVDWLCTNKDYWGKGPLTRKQAEAFVEDEYAPSLMISGGRIAEGMEIAAAMRD